LIERDQVVDALSLSLSLSPPSMFARVRSLSANAEHGLRDSFSPVLVGEKGAVVDICHEMHNRNAMHAGTTRETSARSIPAPAISLEREQAAPLGRCFKLLRPLGPLSTLLFLL
jgi:hypothetical protein